MRDALDEQAGPAGDDGSRHRAFHGLFQGPLHLLQIVGVHNEDLFKAHGLQNLFDADVFGFFTHQGMSGARVVLMAGHGGDAVVQHTGDHVAIVIHDLQGTGDAAVEECTVAQNADDLLVFAPACKGLGHAHTGAETGAHADGGIQSTQRLGTAQSVATDVAGDHHILQAGNFVEKAAVRTAGAKHWRTGHRSAIYFLGLGLLAGEPFPHDARVQLIHPGNDGFTFTGNAGRLDLLFHEGLQLFHHIEFFHLGGKGGDQLHGQRIGDTQFQIGSIVPKDLPGILIGHTGGNDAHFAVSHLHFVQGRCAGVGLHLLQPVFQALVMGLGPGGSGGEFIRVFHIFLVSNLHPFSGLHHTLGMADPGGHTEKHRNIKFLADLIGFLHKVDAVLAVGRLHHGQLGKFGIIPVVLLVLRGVQIWVVGSDDNKSAVDPQIGSGKHGIGGHIQPHMLHGTQAPLSGDGRTIGRFQSHLFIGRPFAVNVLFVLGQIFEDLGAGCAGIGRAKGGSSFIGAPGHRFVARHQLFHLSFLLRLPGR